VLIDRMEEMLSASPWLIGARYSLADIAAVPFIARLDEIEPASLGAEGHPRVNDWWVRVRQRPAFKKARFDRFDETLRARQVGAAG
jgi:glutathione S-transferase